MVLWNKNIFSINLKIRIFSRFAKGTKIKFKFHLHTDWQLTNTFILVWNTFKCKKKNQKHQKKRLKLMTSSTRNVRKQILGCVSRWFYVVDWNDSSQSICFYSKSPQLYTNSTIITHVNLGGCSFFTTASSSSSFYFCCTWTYVSNGCKEYNNTVSWSERDNSSVGIATITR